MNPTEEAAAIFIRLIEALCRRSGKTLNERGRADVRRACELLSHAGEQYGDLLDDMPPPRPRDTISFDAVPREVIDWREKRER